MTDLIDLWAGWMDRGRGWSPQTIRRRRRTLERFAAYIAPVELPAAGRPVVEAFLDEYPTAATRRAYLFDLRSFYAWAVPRGLAPADPTLVVDAPKEPRRLPRPIATDDLERVLPHATPTIRRALLLGLYAGLRRSELVKVHSDDLLVVRGRLSLRVIGKGNKERIVPLHDMLERELRGLRGWAFPSSVNPGQHMHPQYVAGLVSGHLKAYGLTGGIHRARHTCATLMIEHGADVVAVRDVLGHESLSTTMLYVKVSGQQTTAAVLALPELALHELDQVENAVPLAGGDE